jgi:hypothetical protein
MHALGNRNLVISWAVEPVFGNTGSPEAAWPATSRIGANVCSCPKPTLLSPGEVHSLVRGEHLADVLTSGSGLPQQRSITLTCRNKIAQWEAQVGARPAIRPPQTLL